MNREDIIAMAREAGFNPQSLYMESRLERFATLIASRVAAAAKAEEREACAKVCDRVGYHHEVQQGVELAFDLAAAIRARGKA